MHEVSTIKSTLKDLLYQRNDVLAAWEGGSAATGYYDEYSDLDLCIVIEGRDVESIFLLLDEHFAKNYGIQRSFRIPEPAWHGMSQCFYLLKDCPACFYCDIAVVTRDNPNKFTEPDRHGNAVIWFDKASVYTSDITPAEEQEKLVHRVLNNVFSVDFLTIIELQKAVLRKNWIASQMNWQMFLNRCLVPLMNVRYRPAKADFGIRYAKREYPAEVVKVLENLLHYQSVEDIAAKLETALTIYNELKKELGSNYLYEDSV